MTSMTKAPAPAQAETARARSLVAWSFAMLPLYLVAWVVLGMASFALLAPLGLVEGELLLMAHSLVAWLLTIGFYLMMAAAPVAGIVLAAKALHSVVRKAAIAALALNALVLALTVVQLLSEIQLSYFPGIEPW